LSGPDPTLGRRRPGSRRPRAPIRRKFWPWRGRAPERFSRESPRSGWPGRPAHRPRPGLDQRLDGRRDADHTRAQPSPTVNVRIGVAADRRTAWGPRPRPGRPRRRRSRCGGGQGARQPWRAPPARHRTGWHRLRRARGL